MSEIIFKTKGYKVPLIFEVEVDGCREEVTMSRVEENQKFIERVEKEYKEAIEKAGGVQTLLFTNPNIMSLFAEASKNDVLVDISRSWP